MVIEMMFFFAPYVFFFNWYFRLMILGHDSSVIFQKACFSDSWMLLSSAICSLIFHNFMAVRWCMTWPFDVLCVLCYALFSYFWSHESPLIFIAFSFYQVVLTLSHRGAEITNRQMFTLLTDERVQRVQAEFKIEQQQAPAEADDRSITEASSMPSCAEDDFLEELVTIGRREQ